jgi:hypothetical protein
MGKKHEPEELSVVGIIGSFDAVANGGFYAFAKSH